MSFTTLRLRRRLEQRPGPFSPKHDQWVMEAGVPSGRGTFLTGVWLPERRFVGRPADELLSGLAERNVVVSHAVFPTG